MFKQSLIDLECEADEASYLEEKTVVEYLMYVFSTYKDLLTLPYRRYDNQRMSICDQGAGYIYCITTFRGIFANYLEEYCEVKTMFYNCVVLAICLFKAPRKVRLHHDFSGNSPHFKYNFEWILYGCGVCH